MWKTTSPPLCCLFTLRLFPLSIFCHWRIYLMHMICSTSLLFQVRILLFPCVPCIVIVIAVSFLFLCWWIHHFVLFSFSVVAILSSFSFFAIIFHHRPSIHAFTVDAHQPITTPSFHQLLLQQHYQQFLLLFAIHIDIGISHSSWSPMPFWRRINYDTLPPLLKVPIITGDVFAYQQIDLVASCCRTSFVGIWDAASIAIIGTVTSTTMLIIHICIMEENVKIEVKDTEWKIYRCRRRRKAVWTLSTPSSFFYCPCNICAIPSRRSLALPTSIGYAYPSIDFLYHNQMVICYDLPRRPMPCPCYCSTHISCGITIRMFYSALRRTL